MPTKINNLNFSGHIYAGFDSHLESWKITILTNELTLKIFVMPPKSEVLSNYMHSNFPGANYYSAYFDCIAKKLIEANLSWHIQGEFSLWFVSSGFFTDELTYL